MFKRNKGTGSKGYVAINEEPLVLCAYGDSPAEALHEAALLCKREDVSWFSAASVSVLDSDKDAYCVTIYV